MDEYTRVQMDRVMMISALLPHVVELDIAQTNFAPAEVQLATHVHTDLPFFFEGKAYCLSVRTKDPYRLAGDILRRHQEYGLEAVLNAIEEEYLPSSVYEGTSTKGEYFMLWAAHHFSKLAHLVCHGVVHLRPFHLIPEAPALPIIELVNVFQTDHSPVGVKPRDVIRLAMVWEKWGEGGVYAWAAFVTNREVQTWVKHNLCFTEAHKWLKDVVSHDVD